MQNEIGKINCPVCGKEVSYYASKEGGYYIRPHKSDDTEVDYPRPWCEADDITTFIIERNNELMTSLERAKNK